MIGQEVRAFVLSVCAGQSEWPNIPVRTIHSLLHEKRIKP